MGVAFFWFAGALVVGVFAENRGRSGPGWFALSLLISPILGFLFVAVSKNLDPAKNPTLPSAATHRKCPACAELILPEAVVCKHCGQEVKADPGHYYRADLAAKDAEAKKQIKLIMGFAVVVALILAAGMFGK